MKKVLWVLSVFVSVSISVFSADVHWDGGGSDNNWATAENWDTDSVPASGDNVHISPVSTGDLIVNDNDHTSTNYGSVFIDGNASYSAQLNTSDLSASYILLGKSHTGKISQATGSVSTSTLRLSLDPGSWGYYELDSPGSLFVNNSIYVGTSNGGYGQFMQNGGSVRVNVSDLRINAQANSEGKYSIYTINSGTLITKNLSVYSSRNAIFSQMGGTVTVNNRAVINGEYSLVNGDLDVDAYASITGLSSYRGGAFSQVGEDASVNIDGHLTVGYGDENVSYKGSYVMAGGTLNVGEDENIGEHYGEGTFYQTDGVHVIGDSLEVGVSGTGAYYLSGTKSQLVASDGITVGGALGQGSFEQSGGEIRTNRLFLSQTGTYSLSGGALNVDVGSSSTSSIKEYVYGSFSQTGGENTVGGNIQVVGDYTLDATGTAIDANALLVQGSFFHKKGAIDLINGVNNYGIYYGNGIVYGDFFAQRYSVFSPGTEADDVGSFLLEGSLSSIFTLSNRPVFSFDLAGYQQGISYDFLNVLGTASIYTALIDVNLLNGFNPNIGSVFTLLRGWEGITYNNGRNVSVEYDLPDLGPNKWWEIREDNTALYLEVKGNVNDVVPEPGSMALFGIGLLALIRKRRNS